MGRGFLDLNWAATVINTLLIAFFVLAAGGIFIGVYSARTLSKREKAMGGGAPAVPSAKAEKKAAKKAAKAEAKKTKEPKAPTPPAASKDK